MSVADSQFEFSPAGYAALIAALRARGYEAKHYSDAQANKPHLIVRHDVDFSLSAALAMAEQEASLKLRSTYFVLLRTEFYNLMSKNGLSALRRIAALGHDVGLHFDAALYKPDEIEEAAASEAALLEGLLGQPVATVSFHRPAAERIGESERVGGRLNAYSPRFVRDMGYCSDSRGAWHHGAPLEHPAVRDSRALQLLVHPFWWQAPALPPQERLAMFLSEHANFFDHELARHCTVHRAQFSHD